jgi:hypothetical protein
MYPVLNLAPYPIRVEGCVLGEDENGSECK